MELSVRHLRAFVVASEFLNFTKAAAHLNVSQPALSATIQQLEDMLEARLFDRGSRRVRLTAVGELYLGLATRLLADMESSLGVVRDLVEKRQGRLHLAALPSAASEIVAAALKDYRDRYPNVQITLRDGVNDEILELVRRGEVDMGFAICPDDHIDFHKTLVFDDRFVLVAPPDHPLTRQKSVRWDQLVTYPFIKVAVGSNTRRRVDETFAAIGQIVDSAIETTIVTSAVGMVAQNHGITVLSELSMAPFAKLGSVAIRPLIAPEVSRPISLIVRAGRSLSPAADAFRRLVINA